MTIMIALAKRDAHRRKARLAQRWMWISAVVGLVFGWLPGFALVWALASCGILLNLHETAYHRGWLARDDERDALPALVAELRNALGSLFTGVPMRYDDLKALLERAEEGA